MTRLTMFDDVTVALLPDGADAYACYADGRYQNEAAVRARFPHARILTIDVRGTYRNGDCLDVEPGDATNADAVGWFKARNGHTSTTRPVLYTSASNVAALVATMKAAGIPRSDYFIWSAHYSGVEHICGSCGYPQADGTQWTNHALGRSLDQSLIEDYVFAPTKPKTAGTNVEHAIKDVKRAEAKATKPGRKSVLSSVLAALRGLRK